MSNCAATQADVASSAEFWGRPSEPGTQIITQLDLLLFEYSISRAFADRLRAKEFTMLPIDRPGALRIVQQAHYARGAANTGVRFHGLFRKDNLADCLGVAWWLPPAPGAGRLVSPERPGAVLGLHRFAILPGVPKNAATFLLGAARRALKREQRFSGLITYADSAQTYQGFPHRGRIYLAENWKEIGPTTTRHPRWLDQEGRQVSPKRGPRTLSYGEMEALGYTREPGSLKYRFVVRF